MTRHAVSPIWALPLALAACTGEPPVLPDHTDITSGADADEDGFSLAQGDCDDTDANFYPGANDVAGDALDQNCDGTDGVDADLDGHAWTGSGGDDCDDAEPNVNPSVEEIGWDDVDQDCDGRDRFDFDVLAAGEDHTCGVDSTGRLRCWGGDEFGQRTAYPQEAGWESVCAGVGYSCAVHEDGRVACWGKNDLNQVSDAPTGADYDTVACGHTAACALDRDGYATCWGDDSTFVVSEAPTAVKWRSISVGLRHGCGVNQTEGRVVCWGSSDDVQEHVPYQVDFISVTSGKDFACALRSDLGLDCFGLNTPGVGQTDAPSDAGPYAMLAAKDSTTCGILNGDTLSCWGRDVSLQVTDAPTTTDARYVAMGHEHGCILRALDGEPQCWGRDLDGQASPPWP